MDNGEYQVAALVVDNDSKVTTARDLYFDFNPSEYTVAKSSNWTRPQMKGGKQTGKPEFQGANALTLQMEIFFDQRHHKNGETVADAIATLFEWVKPTDDSIKKKSPQPPILHFEWGANMALKLFRGYLKTVSAKYLLFDGTGKPLRATANITLEEVPVPPKKQNPTSGSIHGRRTQLVGEGDSLASIAWQEYEDPGLWRGIAEFNGIDDPLRVRAGTTIVLPTADEARRLA